jgi:heme exporter protein D
LGERVIQDYLQMGGYAAFVWPAYGVSALVLAGLVLTSLAALKRSERTLADLEARGIGRRPRLEATPPDGNARHDA